MEEDKHTSSKSGRRQRGGGVGRVGTKGGHGCVVSPESGDVDSPSTSYDGLRYVCCSVLQCVAVCCSVLQCVAVFCSVLQCVAVRCSVSSVCMYVLDRQIHSTQ